MMRGFMMAALLLSATPALAARPVKPGPLRLDPRVGYILVRAGPVVGRKGKVPLLYFARYDPVRQMVRSRAKSDANRVPKGEDENVAVGSVPFDMLDSLHSVFLIAVTPGEYVFDGTATTSFGLGSYGFTVRPGVVTDIGTIHQGRPGGAAFPEVAEQATSPDLVARGYVTDTASMTAATDVTALPRQLQGVAVERATLVPDRRFANIGNRRPGFIGGVFVNRMIGLPPLTNGDGREWVAALRKADPDTKVGPAVEPEKPPTPVATKSTGGV